MKVAVKAIIAQKHWTKFLKPTGCWACAIEKHGNDCWLDKVYNPVCRKDKNPRIETLLLLSLQFPLKVRTEQHEKEWQKPSRLDCVFRKILNHQFSSVAQSCPTPCDPMIRSTPGLPVHHHLVEFTQTHIHRVSDAIQPSHPRSSPSPPAPNPSQHQSLFQRVNSSHEVAKVLELQL